MKKVFVANKHSYGSEFCIECNSLDELKREIVEHEIRFSKEPMMYTEELFKEISIDYTLYEVDLHDDEYISWREYDGQSWFEIKKRNPNILSIVKGLDEGE